MGNVAYKSEAMPPAKKRVAQQVSKGNVVDIVAVSLGTSIRHPAPRKPPLGSRSLATGCLAHSHAVSQSGDVRHCWQSKPRVEMPRRRMNPLAGSAESAPASAEEHSLQRSHPELPNTTWHWRGEAHNELAFAKRVLHKARDPSAEIGTLLRAFKPDGVQERPQRDFFAISLWYP